MAKSSRFNPPNSVMPAKYELNRANPRVRLYSRDPGFPWDLSGFSLRSLRLEGSDLRRVRVASFLETTGPANRMRHPDRSRFSGGGRDLARSLYAAPGRQRRADDANLRFASTESADEPHARPLGPPVKTRTPGTPQSRTGNWELKLC